MVTLFSSEFHREFKPKQFQISRSSWAHQQWRHKVYFRQFSRPLYDYEGCWETAILPFQYLSNASSNSFETSEYVYFTLKAGVHTNTSEIWSNIERELLGLKWIGNTTRQLTPSKKSPRLVGDCLVSVLLLILHSNFNFSNPSNLQHFIFSSI